METYAAVTPSSIERSGHFLCDVNDPKDEKAILDLVQGPDAFSGFDKAHTRLLIVITGKNRRIFVDNKGNVLIDGMTHRMVSTGLDEIKKLLERVSKK